MVGPEDVKITTRVGHPDQRIYSVKKVYMHSQFRPGDHDHDIAIVEVNRINLFNELLLKI